MLLSRNRTSLLVVDYTYGYSAFVVLSILSFILGATEMCNGSELNATQIREAMRAERGKLISGKFTANGLSTVENSNDGTLPKTESVWRYEFDLSTKAFVFDRVQSIKPNIKLRGSLNDKLRVLFAKDASETFGYNDLTSNILFIEANNKVEKTLDEHFRNINAYGFGFLNLEPLIDSINVGDDAFFDRIKQGTSTADIEVKNISETIIELSYTSDSNFKKSLHIDTSKGYAPIRHTSTYGDSLSFDNRTDWEQVNNVWVPIVLTGEEHTPYIPNGKEHTPENLVIKKRETRYVLDWSSVNSNSIPAVIDYQKFDLPTGTSAFKDGENVFIYGSLNQPQRPQPIQLKTSRKPLFLFILIAIVFTAVIGFLLRIRHVRRN